MTTATANPIPAEPPAEGAFRALLRTCGLVGRVMQPYFARFGISGAQWGVLRTLSDSHMQGVASLRLTDLSGRLLIRPPSVTGVVDRLVRMGLVARHASATDARSKEVWLTTSGRDLVRRILENHAAQIHSVLAGLSEDEQWELYRLLDRLRTHLETIVGVEEHQTLLNEGSSHE